MRNKFLSFKSKYNIYNLIIIPLLFCFLSGYMVAPIIIPDLANEVNTNPLNGFQLYFGVGWALMVFYYPVKIIAFLFKRLIYKKWEWGYSYSYWVLPIIATTLLFILGGK